MTLTPFHVAVQVRDLDEARRFYGGVLGCAEGRSARDWVDFNLYGHQFVCHVNPGLGPRGRLTAHFNPVDGHGVPGKRVVGSMTHSIVCRFSRSTSSRHVPGSSTTPQ